MAKTIYILNGPNLNLLGTREPEIYGTTTLADIEAICLKHAEKHGLSVSFHQSNDEGVLVELIQEARSSGMGVIINAGAYTHTSVAILDAILALEIPVVEVHLSNLFKREEFRHHSFITPAAQGLICGLGAQGYVMAIDYLSQS